MTLEQQISMIKRGITVNMLPSVTPVIEQTPENAFPMRLAPFTLVLQYG